jgi:chemotaxis protein CheD
MLFHSAYRLGAEKRRLVVWAAGGAQVMDDSGVFNIGKRNNLALRKILWKAGVMIHGEEVGGTTARTVRLEVGTGRFMISGPGMETHQMLATAGGKGRAS